MWKYWRMHTSALQVTRAEIRLTIYRSLYIKVSEDNDFCGFRESSGVSGTILKHRGAKQVRYMVRSTLLQLLLPVGPKGKILGLNISHDI